MKSFSEITDKENLAYVVGAAIGDGNLSNPNGRATKLRVTCDNKYPNLENRIFKALQVLLPNNKVNRIVRPRNCTDVYVCSNKLESLFGWQVGKGSKYNQRVRVPTWIKSDQHTKIACLKGLFETDGSVYYDRGYRMVNFTTIIPELAEDVMNMIIELGFKPRCYKIVLLPPRQTRYNIRISKNTEQFIQTINLIKD